MNGAEATLWCLCFAYAFVGLARAGRKTQFDVSNDTLRFDITRGVKLYVANDEASVVIKMSTFLEEGNEIEQRGKRRMKFNSSTLHKIGMAMMMAPMVMQLMSLPGTLASIKFSLLRSLVVGKIALLAILFNIFRKSQRSEVVLVHKPEYHEHYYHTYHQPEDDDEGWVG